jgi:hypothetical protein
MQNPVGCWGIQSGRAEPGRESKPIGCEERIRAYSTRMGKQALSGRKNTIPASYLARAIALRLIQARRTPDRYNIGLVSGRRYLNRSPVKVAPTLPSPARVRNQHGAQGLFPGCKTIFGAFNATSQEKDYLAKEKTKRPQDVCVPYACRNNANLANLADLALSRIYNLLILSTFFFFESLAVHHSNGALRQQWGQSRAPKLPKNRLYRFCQPSTPIARPTSLRDQRAPERREAQGQPSVHARLGDRILRTEGVSWPL